MCHRIGPQPMRIVTSFNTNANKASFKLYLTVKEIWNMKSSNLFFACIFSLISLHLSTMWLLWIILEFDLIFREYFFFFLGFQNLWLYWYIFGVHVKSVKKEKVQREREKTMMICYFLRELPISELYLIYLKRDLSRMLFCSRI